MTHALRCQLCGNETPGDLELIMVPTQWRGVYESEGICRDALACQGRIAAKIRAEVEA